MTCASESRDDTTHTRARARAHICRYLSNTKSGNERTPAHGLLMKAEMMMSDPAMGLLAKTVCPAPRKHESIKSSSHQNHCSGHEVNGHDMESSS